MKITQYFELGIMAFLLVMSVWSVAIMIDRRRVFKIIEMGDGREQWRNLIGKREWNTLRQTVEKSEGLRASALAAALGAAARNGESVDRAVRSHLTDERLRLEKGLPVLATLGANAPFIGLFGTVLGIIQAFAALGDASGGANTVMAGISRALYATAAGLFVAIPAVVAFNHFSSRARKLLSECEALKDYYLSQLGGGE